MSDQDRTGVVAVGSAHLDLIAVTAQLPSPGESQTGTDFLISPGGKAANQATQLARLGVPVSLVAKIGTDRFGDYLVESLESEHVDLSYSRRDPVHATGASPIHVGPLGEYASVIVPGAAALLSRDDLEVARPAFRRARFALVQLELPLQTARQATTIAAEEGCLLIMNASPVSSPDPEALWSMLERSTMIIVNRKELAALGRLYGVAVDHQIEQADLLREATGAELLVVTLGADGALACTPADTVHMPAFPVTVVDTVGSGDAFLGAFLYGQIQGATIEECLRWGAAAGALAATRPGAFGSLPSLDELQRFLA